MAEMSEEAKKVGDWILAFKKKNQERLENSRLKEERFRGAMGMRLKVPKRPPVGS